MFQLYPFRGEDCARVYARVNAFLQQLDEVSGIEIKRDEVREDTKNYLDYARSVTTVTVCVHFVDCYRPVQAARVAEVTALYDEIVDTYGQAVTDSVATESVVIPTADDFDPFLEPDADLP